MKEKAIKFGPGGIKCDCCRGGLSLKEAKRRSSKANRKKAKKDLRSGVLAVH